jgi:ribosome-associated protein
LCVQTGSEERRHRGKTKKHGSFHSTIKVGDKFLIEADTQVNTRTSTDILTNDPEATLPNWLIAVRAAQSKKAAEIKVLDLTGVTTFTDYFLLCNGGNTKQMQAITDEIALQLKKIGERPISIEGYEHGEWVLSDYSDLIVHVFSEKARAFYDLDRLWRQGRIVDLPAE